MKLLKRNNSYNSAVKNKMRENRKKGIKSKN